MLREPLGPTSRASTPENRTKLSALPPVNSPVDILDNLPLLKYLAYQADVDGHSQSFNAYLKQTIIDVLPDTASLISIKLNESAQSNLAKVEMDHVVLILTVNLIFEADDCTYQEGNTDSVLKIQQLLKKLYHLVDYMDRPGVAEIVSILFPNTFTYPEQFELILDSFSSLKKESLTPKQYAMFAMGQVRGMIMLLLNFLPTLLFTNEDDIAAWKAFQHLSNFYQPQRIPTPQYQLDSTVGLEWDQFKPPSDSKLISNYNLIEEGVENIFESSGSESAEDPKEDTDDTSAISKHLQKGIDSLTHYVTRLINDHPAWFPPIFGPMVFHSIEHTFRSFQDFSILNKNGGNIFFNAINSIFLHFELVSCPKLNKNCVCILIMVALYSTLDNVLYEQIKLMGPVALLSSDIMFSCAVVRSVLSNFKKKKPFVKQIPFGEITTVGFGTFKVVDDVGCSFKVNAFYSPDSLGKSLALDPHSNEVGVKMSEALPIMISLDHIKKHCDPVVDVNGKLYFKHKGEGRVHTLRRGGYYYVPLKQSHELVVTIQSLETVEKRLWKNLAIMNSKNWKITYPGVAEMLDELQYGG
ncbi:hypothetical protein DIURU_002541 [Diutina rugosa]|uniref:Uncharacterized protein n=1 Tax=Diutina rugosa TaxID=5481 RepID=A0A642UPV6_DIURU|nr:uncharacterized protein DIURU_002541 [Diutina rugosa]KAA8903254.1 hypothetical protein DIURU_002541 [Diutina rugosa]